jgi:hypothetical protein
LYEVLSAPMQSNILVNSQLTLSPVDNKQQERQ